MGKFIEVKAEDIIPSQDYIKEPTIKFILKCILDNELGKLPPTPILRKSPFSNELIAIDGHNLIVINDLLDKSFKVYVAENANDYLNESEPNNSLALEMRNMDLQNKFDNALQEAQILKNAGIGSIKDLRSKYPFLKNLQEAKKYFFNQ